jgi:hypothetical protein
MPLFEKYETLKSTSASKQQNPNKSFFIFLMEWTAHARDVPADGTCMFHAVGVPFQINGHALRAVVAEYILRNPDSALHDQPLRNWILWDQGVAPETYAESLKRGQWGGSLDMTILASLLKTVIFVYEPKGSKCVRISEARPDASVPSLGLRSLPHVCVLYVRKNHYMYLEVSKPRADNYND